MERDPQGNSVLKRLGRYEVIAPLGRGGMGEVFIGRAVGEAGFEKPVVIKCLLRELSQDPNRVQDLIREANLEVRLEHEHIVQVFDLAREGDQLFLVMEYVRGYDLGRILAFHRRRREPLPLEAVAHVGRAVLDALAHAHELCGPDGKQLGVVHRDVSPPNILIGADGRVKLADFGIAKIRAAPELTRPGIVKGKLPYLAPEALEEQAVDHRFDLYSAGVVLYESLAGIRPFTAETETALVARVAAGQFVPLATVRPDLPPAVSALVERALRRDPAERFASAREMARALDEAVPSKPGERERFRSFVSALYAAEPFRSEAGELPPPGTPSRPLPQPAVGSDWMGDGATRPSAFGPAVFTRPTAAATPSAIRRRRRRAIAVASAIVAIGLAAALSYPLRARAPGPLTVALTPASGMEAARAGAAKLADYLARRLARPCQPHVGTDYQALADELAGGRVDLAWLPPFAYLRAAQAGATSLAVTRRGGRTSYQSALVVRRDAQTRTIAELKGKRVGWVDKESASGHLFARAMIADVAGDVDAFLGPQRFLGSHREVVQALADAWVDAGATFVSLDDGGKVATSGWDQHLGERAGEIRVLALSDPIPGDTIAARPGLAESDRRTIAAALLGMSADPEGREILQRVFNRADGFVRPEVAAYEPVRRAAKALEGQGAAPRELPSRPAK